MFIASKKKGEKNAIAAGSRPARALFLVMLSVIVSLSLLGIVSGDAQASTFTDDSYVNQLMTGNANDGGGWNENVITNLDPSLKGTDAGSVTKDISNFFNALAIWIVSIGIVLAVARLAFRGVYEMVASNDEDLSGTKGGRGAKGGGGMPGFLKTSQERNDGKHIKNWGTPMLIETAIFIGVALFVGAIIEILLGVGMTVIDITNSSYNAADPATVKAK